MFSNFADLFMNRGGMGGMGPDTESPYQQMKG